jgi:hypothetical protein
VKWCVIKTAMSQQSNLMCSKEHTIFSKLAGHDDSWLQGQW